MGGCKGRPKNGLGQVGYTVLPDFQGNGYATEATRVVVSWAFSHPEVTRVAAETLPDLGASSERSKNVERAFRQRGT